MRQDFLPAEFSSISNAVSHVVKRTANEWSSSCPQCKGSIHKNGEPPDRFRMWLVSSHGLPLGWCRKCNYVWTPAKDRKPTKEEIEFWQKQQIEVERERKEEAERALELLQNEKMWEKFFVQNNDYSKGLFRERGIADSWVEYLKLGLVPDYTVKSRENGDWEYYHSPAISIPIWNVGGIVQNIKLRVTNPRRSGDRYRNWYEAGQSYLYVPLYDMPLTGTCVLVEGEFKSIIMEQTLDDINLRVVGVQSKSPSSAIFDQLKDFDLIYVWLDPDSFVVEYDSKGQPRETAVERMVRLLGKERVRIVNCSVKSDDGIISGDIDPKKYLAMARRAT